MCQTLSAACADSAFACQASPHKETEAAHTKRLAKHHTKRLACQEALPSQRCLPGSTQRGFCHRTKRLAKHHHTKRLSMRIQLCITITIRVVHLLFDEAPESPPQNGCVFRIFCTTHCTHTHTHTRSTHNTRTRTHTHTHLSAASTVNTLRALGAECKQRLCQKCVCVCMCVFVCVCVCVCVCV